LPHRWEPRQRSPKAVVLVADPAGLAVARGVPALAALAALAQEGRQGPVLVLVPVRVPAVLRADPAPAARISAMSRRSRAI